MKLFISSEYRIARNAGMKPTDQMLSEYAQALGYKDVEYVVCEDATRNVADLQKILQYADKHDWRQV